MVLVTQRTVKFYGGASLVQKVYWFEYKAGNLEHSELIIFLIGLAALIVLHLKLLFHLLIWSQTVGCTRIA